MSNRLSKDSIMKKNPGTIMRSVEIKIKQVPMSVIELPTSQAVHIPDYMRYAGAEPNLEEAFLPLQTYLGMEADVERVKVDPPTEGAFYKDVLLVPCEYLTRIFPERKSDIDNAKAVITSKFMEALPTMGEA